MHHFTNLNDAGYPHSRPMWARFGMQKLTRLRFSLCGPNLSMPQRTRLQVCLIWPCDSLIYVAKICQCRKWPNCILVYVAQICQCHNCLVVYVVLVSVCSTSVKPGHHCCGTWNECSVWARTWPGKFFYVGNL